MKKWAIAALGLAGFLMLSVPAMADDSDDVIRIVLKMRGGTDVDNQCVINCLDRTAECKAADRLRCQSECKRPPSVTQVVGSNVLSNPSIPDLSQCGVNTDNLAAAGGSIQRCYDQYYSAVSSLSNSLFGQSNTDFQSFTPVITTFTSGAILSSVLHFLPAGFDIPVGPGVETYPMIDNIGCTWGKEARLPITGAIPAGCAETPAFGPGGWAALGCTQSMGCCYKPGTNGVVGYGVCSVNSTTPGNGFYNN